MTVTRKQPRIGLLIAAIVGGIIVVQMFAKRSEPSKRPGSDRGDWVLVQSNLPDEIDGWKLHSIKPAPEPDQLPLGECWWVHQWVYQKANAHALVTLDQLGESGWHELTYCYHGSGWQIDTRTKLYDAVFDGAHVLAELGQESGEQTILLFSVFFEDGTWTHRRMW